MSSWGFTFRSMGCAVVESHESVLFSNVSIGERPGKGESVK